MILNTGNRTDIPAFYSDWFFSRVKEGIVLSRSPYDPAVLYRYRIDPEVVDVISFCTKDPSPMLPRLGELGRFRQFWQVTITPYGKEIEPGVPSKAQVLNSFRELSRIVGAKRVCWRYDPIFLSDTYTIDYHEEAFSRMASYLSGYTERCVISFIDLYEKTKQNFPEAKVVAFSDRKRLGESFARIAKENGMKLHTCLEGEDLACFGVDTTGCMTKQVLEEAIGEELLIPPGTSHAREGCSCLLSGDIGAYNTCRHFCRYCYANYSREAVLQNSRMHDPDSSLLVGNVRETDVIRDMRQMRYATGQQRIVF